VQARSQDARAGALMAAGTAAKISSCKSWTQRRASAPAAAATPWPAKS